MTFTIKIELGNEAMQDPSDVAEALERVADDLRDFGFAHILVVDRKIRDLNGNTVGEWGMIR